MGKITEKRERQLARRQKHLEELQRLGYTGQTLRPLKLIENEAARAALAACNGEMTDEEYSNIEMRLSNRVAVLFGGKLPHGFFINGDPRGYALKLDDEAYSRDPRAADYMPISFTDWGGFGILAPEDF